MKFGLRESDLAYINEVLNKYDVIDKTVIFGSRAKGNYKPGSDIDLALSGNHINFDTVAKVKYELEEKGGLPYFVDVVDYSHLNHEGLKEHIDRVGVVLFERS